MSSEKAPGPDGFNGAFYQKQCDILGKDIISAVQSFYVCGKLLMDVNHTFLTLISKVSNSSNLTDFMPISCYNVLYKVISKTFKQQTSNSDYWADSNQSAFLKGRQISDCSLLAHELIRDLKKLSSKGCCNKINLHKAFDSINRNCVAHDELYGLPSHLAAMDRRVYLYSKFLCNSEWLPLRLLPQQQRYQARWSFLTLYLYIGYGVLVSMLGYFSSLWKNFIY